MYTEQEQALISKLLPELQEMSKKEKHYSLFQNYCANSALPILEPGTKVDWCEFYYNDEPQPALFFAEGHLVSVNMDDIEDPATLEIVGVDGTLYIQVEGIVLLNRLRFAALPDFSSQKIAKEMDRLEKLMKELEDHHAPRV